MSKDYSRYQEGLIKSILARPEEIVTVVEYIDSSDFDDVHFKIVYESILELYLEKKPIALPEIALKIGEAGGTIDAGWLFNLDTNIAQWVQTASPLTWAKLLKRESSKHKARDVINEGLADISDNKKNPLDVIDQLSDKLTRVSVDASSGGVETIEDVIDDFEEQTKAILRDGGNIATINSAYPTIDYYTKGWGATHLITIGARTGIGKSVFAINNAVAAMAQEKSVLFFSLEMTQREVISRMVASLSLIRIQDIEKAAPLTEDENQRQKDALAMIRKSKLTIDTNPSVTVEYIKRAAIKQAQSENGLDFVIIDYLQLISNDSKSNRQEAISDVSRNMKLLAKELNVPVMVLVQLNRESRNSDGDDSPKIYDIRESGSIANDSNVVILIDRKKYEDDDEMIDPKATFIIAKNRQGEDNKYITVRTRLESSLFIDDNDKGQQLMRDLEESVESGGDYEENFESEAYKNPNSQFDDIDIDTEAFEDLFNEEQDAFGGGDY